ncbi:MAG: patatin-like phospholipase family protein, partial [Sphingomonadales bacterium]
NQRLFLDRDEWAGIFPAPVMAAIAAKAWHSGPVPEGVGFAAADVDQAAAASGVPRDRLLLLPRAADLPVLVAARASMAFPGLFTPVPLWLLRWVPDGAGGKAPVLSQVLLADGGITSNFPIHLFDSPLPGRPTFALNLLYEGEEVAEARPPSGMIDGNQAVPEQVTGLAGGGLAALAAVFMPFTNRGRVGYYQPPAQGSGFAQIAGLLGRVVDTARMWGDVGLFDQPGVRDRIAHIRLASDEGGFNLNMPAETIKRLSDKGALAGDVLASRFHPSAPSDPLANGAMPRLNWHNHRFVRLRATLAAQQQLAGRFALRWPGTVSATAQQQPGPADLLAGANGQWQVPGGPAFPIGYSFNLTKAERGRLASLAGNLAGLALPPASPARNDQPPRPRAILQMRPDTTDGR